MYDFEHAPAHILVDAKGLELWRNMGEIDLHELRAAVAPHN